jgi:hypothetical protein
MFAVGVLLVWSVSTMPTLPNPGFPRFVAWLVPFFFAAIVYFFFVFYGGQHAAFRNAKMKRVPCPFCQLPIEAYPGDAGTSPRFLEQQCPGCGQTLNIRDF